MSRAGLQQQRAHLELARVKVRAGVRWTVAIVLATSLLGIVGVWLLELGGSTAAAGGVIAGVLLVIWMVSGTGLLLTFLLLGLAALASGGLQVLERATNNQRLDNEGTA